MKQNDLVKTVFFYEQKAFILLFCLFFIGQTFGSFYFFSSAESFEIKNILTDQTVAHMFLGDFLFLFLLFITGYTIIGFPVICLAVLYRGLCFGIQVCALTYTYGVKGCFLTAILLVLYYIAVIFSNMFVSFSSLKMSIMIYNIYKSETRLLSPKAYSKPHIIRFIIFSVVLFLAALYYKFIATPILTLIL